MLAHRLVAVTAVLVGAFCVHPAPAAADEVLLRNGFSLKGRVDDRGDQLVIHSPSGRVWVPKSQVKRIIKRETQGEIFERKLRALLDSAPEDLDGRVRLAKWAIAHRMRRTGRNQLQAVLDIDPDHAGARRALGFVRHEQAWVTPDEQKRLLGLVRDDGEWITHDEAELRRAKRADVRDAARVAADIELAQAETRKRTAEARIAEAQARTVEDADDRSYRRWYADVILHSGGFVHGSAAVYRAGRHGGARSHAGRLVPAARRPHRFGVWPFRPPAGHPLDPHTRARTGHQRASDPHTRLRTGHRSLTDPHTRLVPSNYLNARR